MVYVVTLFSLSNVNSVRKRKRNQENACYEINDSIQLACVNWSQSVPFVKFNGFNLALGYETCIDPRKVDQYQATFRFLK